MTILLVLIPLGFVLLCIALAAFVWAVQDGQFEDLEGEGSRILFEDDPISGPSSTSDPSSTPSLSVVADDAESSGVEEVES